LLWGFEADTASDEKLSGASDSALCERCRTEDRVLNYTDDAPAHPKSFGKLH
jgi:hypothetical protein